MSQLTLNCLQEANLLAKPYAHNGTEDKSLGGLGVFHWKRKRSMQQAIVSFNPGGGKKTYGQTKRKETQKNITKVITINIFARNILFAVTSSVSQL